MNHFFASFLLALVLSLNIAPFASAEPPPSRLSQLRLNQSTLYMPARLIIGEENRFTIKGIPGNNVRLLISPQPEGMTLPNGTALRVSEENEKLEGVIPENGVLNLMLPVPNEEAWVGNHLYVDAITWKQEDLSDMAQLQLVDSSGRRATLNALELAKAATRGGSAIMPAIPGMPANLMQQLNTAADALTGDERKKSLIYDGTRDQDNLMDRNSLLNRPGSFVPDNR